MDQVWNAVGVVLAALLLELGRRGLSLWQKAEDRSAVVGAVSRAAGQVVTTLRAEPAAAEALDTLVTAGAAYVASAVAPQVARLGVPRATLEAMVRGELGKLPSMAAGPIAGHIGAERQ